MVAQEVQAVRCLDHPDDDVRMMPALLSTARRPLVVDEMMSFRIGDRLD